MLTPIAPRGPSSPEAQCFFRARVGYLKGAASRAQGQTAQEGLTWWMTTQLHDTATMRTTTPSRFRCTYVSSGNPVIYNWQLILFYEVKIYCFLASATSS
jgi:hypothetical protein